MLPVVEENWQAQETNYKGNSKLKSKKNSKK